MRQWSNRLLAAALALLAGTAVADDARPYRGGGQWWQGAWNEPFAGSACEVKIESKRNEFKREIKCPGGVGAGWGRPRKLEFRDGPCLIKQDIKRDEFKEEIKCR